MERKENAAQEEYQQLFQMLYAHFNNTSAAGVKYDEENPHTWPSNWKRQAPLMIIRPDAYLDNRPHFNSYQRQLVRRLALKYQPLVRYYKQCIKSANSQSDNYSSAYGEHLTYERKPLRKLPNVALSWNKVKKIYIRRSN